MMKRIGISVLVVLLLPTIAFGEPDVSDRHIIVMGEAVVKVEPDKVILTLGIETWNKDVSAAKQENNQILQKAITICVNNGVENQNIQTDYLNIEPRYKDDYRKKSFIGYFVRNSIAVTITDLTKLETIITEVLKSGVNYIHGIEFQTDKFKERGRFRYEPK